MIKTFITGAVISQGYENAPALKFSEKGDAVRFRIGHKVYDPNAKDNHRWINLPVKAFGTLCDRIRKMKLQAGSYVNLLGRLDEDEWTDRDGELHRTMVVILDEIEYSGGQKKESPKKETEPSPVEEPEETGSTFTGFEAFGGPNAFFDD